MSRRPLRRLMSGPFLMLTVVVSVACAAIGPDKTAPGLELVLPTSVGDKNLATEVLSSDDIAALMGDTAFGEAFRAAFGALPASAARAEAPSLMILAVRAPGDTRSFSALLQQRLSVRDVTSHASTRFEHAGMPDGGEALVWTIVDPTAGSAGVGATLEAGGILYIIEGGSREVVMAALGAISNLSRFASGDPT